MTFRNLSMTHDDASSSDTPAPVIVEPENARVVYADWIVTGGAFEGVVNISLGTVDYSLRAGPDEPFRVLVCANLRMSAAFAGRLHSALSHILGLEPHASDVSPPPPSTLVN